MQMEKSIDTRKQARSAFIRSSAFQRLIIIAVIILWLGNGTGCGCGCREM